MKETYRIEDLEQLRLLSDPLKLKIVQAFAEEPGTVSKIAAELGENLTRLYRHVDALHEAGLIEITREEKKRGTVERTFCAVARRFEVEQSLFTADHSGGDAVRELLRAGQEELLDALENGAEDNQLLLMRLRIKGSPARIERLRNELEQWLTDVQEDDDASDGSAEAGALIAFYPIRR